MLVSDTSPLDAWGPDSAAACHTLATRLMQALTEHLFSLPAEPVAGGRLVRLPAPTLALPREKPLPKPRPPTKWELFAQRKGIQKRKRSSLMYDENTDKWQRRHGYGRGNDEAAVPIVDARPDDQPGEDPFTQQRAAKRGRVAAQDKRQLANLKAAAKAGAALPPTLRLAAALPEHGRGAPARRRELKQELSAATRQAAVSTASAGKFDRRVAGERPQDRPQGGRKRKFLAVTAGGAEREQASKTVDSILRRHADDIVDFGKAINKYEAAAREERAERKKKKGGGGRAANAPAAAAGGKAGKGGKGGNAAGKKGGKKR